MQGKVDRLLDQDQIAEVSFERVASVEDAAQVSRLAHEIWNDHFVPIIGQKQVDYMLHKFQSVGAITRQLSEGYEYYLTVCSGDAVGYFAVVPQPSESRLMLSKFYMKKSMRGQGYGKAVLGFVERLCRSRQLQTIWLTVNRHNDSSIAWYEHAGFTSVVTVVQDIGEGYVMDDFRMEKAMCAEWPGEMELKLLVATRNPHKLEEIRAILRGSGIQLVSPDEFGELPEVEEDADTFEGNAIKKAVTLAEASGLWTMADDSGLEVDVLGGAPGVYSARYAGEPPDYDANNAKLLTELEGNADRRGRFRCVIALSDPGGRTEVVDGSCEGRIADACRGKGGFGYDPLFIPESCDCTFAELEPDLKNSISHRGRALAAARARWFAEAPCFSEGSRADPE